MKKLFKLLVALVILAVIAVIAIPFLIPLDTYKQEATAKLTEKLGREVRIDGDVSLSLVPNLAVTLEDVTIGNPAGFKTKEFIHIKSLDVEVALKPLFDKRIKIQKLVLDEPNIQLMVNAAGQPNWDIKLQDEAPMTLEGPASITNPLISDAYAAGDASDFDVSTISLSGIQISDGTLGYVDAKQGIEHHLQKVNATVEAVAYSQPLTIGANAVINQEKTSLSAKTESLKKWMTAKKSTVNAKLSNKHVNLVYNGLVSTTGAQGKIDVSSGSASALMAWLGQSIGYDKTPLAFALKGDMKCGLASCGVSGANITVDNVVLAGSAAINWTGAVPSLTAKLTSPSVDVNPYLASAAPFSHGFELVSSAWAQSDHWDNTPIDLSALRTVNADVSLTTPSFKAQGYHLQDVSVHAGLNGGKLALNIHKAGLFGGTIKGGIHVVQGHFSKKMTIAGIDMDQLLTATSGNSKLKGNATMQINVNASGNSQADWVRTSQGSGNIVVRDGALKGMNLAQMSRNIKTAFKGGDDTAQQTDFTELKGSFTIKEGIVHNQDLTMKSPFLRLKGKGSINLLFYTIAYRLLPELVETSKGQDGKDKRGIVVPIMVSGSLNNPQFHPDLESLVTDAINDPEKLKENIGAVKDRITSEKQNIKEMKKDLKQEFKQLKEDPKELLKDPNKVQDLLGGFGL